jgi:hypothetical protein
VTVLGAAAALGTVAFVSTGGLSGAAAGSGAIGLQEGVGQAVCQTSGSGSSQSDSCAIDLLGGGSDQVPGGRARSTTVTLTNTGSSTPGAAGLVTGACSTVAASDDHGVVGTDTAFCSKVDVTVADTTPGAPDKCVFPTRAAACPALSSANTLAGLADATFAAPLSTPAAGASATYVVTVELDATAGNADQGMAATLPMTWSLTK